MCARHFKLPPLHILQITLYYKHRGIERQTRRQKIAGEPGIGKWVFIRNHKIDNIKRSSDIELSVHKYGFRMATIYALDIYETAEPNVV